MRFFEASGFQLWHCVSGAFLWRVFVRLRTINFQSSRFLPSVAPGWVSPLFPVFSHGPKRCSLLFIGAPTWARLRWQFHRSRCASTLAACRLGSGPRPQDEFRGHLSPGNPGSVSRASLVGVWGGHWAVAQKTGTPKWVALVRGKHGPKPAVCSLLSTF